MMMSTLKSASFFVAAFLFCTASSVQAISRTDLLGDLSPPAAAQYTIVIRPDTKYVNIGGGDTVKFIAGNQTFTWIFNVGQTVASFDLNQIAPPGMLNHRVIAYVTPDPRYTGRR
jgi:hypothetical protein